MGKKVIVPLFLITMLLLTACAPSQAANSNRIPNTGNIVAQVSTATIEAPSTGSIVQTIPAVLATPKTVPTLTPAPKATENLITPPTAPDAQTPLVQTLPTLTFSTEAPFTVTEVDTAPALVSLSYLNGCAATYTFSANILTNGAGTVTYYWARSDGTQTAKATLTYTSAGVQTVADTWTLTGTSPAGISGWERIYIDQPNKQFFPTAGVNLSCDPPLRPSRPKLASKFPTPSGGSSSGTPAPTFPPRK